MRASLLVNLQICSAQNQLLSICYTLQGLGNPKPDLWTTDRMNKVAIKEQMANCLVFYCDQNNIFCYHANYV